MNKRPKYLFFSISLFLIILAIWGWNSANNAIVGEWDISFITDGNGKVVLCSENQKDHYPSVYISQASLTCENNDLIISIDKEQYFGTYSLKKSNLISSIYDFAITINQNEYEGLIVASKSSRLKFSDHDYLTMTIMYHDQTYTIFFQGADKH